MRQLVIIVALAGILSGCTFGVPIGDRSGDSQTTYIPKTTPSAAGNPSSYIVAGKRYYVLDSPHGFRQRGLASWYGKKFHGRLTSSREPYDMHAMTAAHTTLPLPTYVRVRNLRNNKSVIVRVNDRGPFVSNRIIDLSYAAARRLDMIQDGTSLVEVTALTVNDSSSPLRRDKRPAVPNEPVTDSLQTLWLQAGAFGNSENADRRLQLLRNSGISTAFVAADHASRPVLFRVRIGPISDVASYDRLVEQLRAIGVTETHLVSE